MIERTDEMRAAVKRRMGVPDGTEIDPWMDAAIEDVLAIVERDLTEQVEREWDALRWCPSTDPDRPGYRCEQQEGHDGPHRAMRWHLEWTGETLP